MKAVGLLSGGLDSTLAARVILDQGIEVEALKFTSPFCNCDHGGKCFSAEVAVSLGLKLITIAKGNDYLSVIRNPKHGYGSAMNPCIDCRIYMLSRAKEYAEESGAGFIFTGEVLGQRPMSQHRAALDMIEKESGLQGKLLRPLSARYLPETDVEKKGLVDREKLLDIAGRSRKRQFGLAKEFGISTFSCPAGGCLLTEKNFAARLKDHFAHYDQFTMTDALILKNGRHFRNGEIKVVVGRNEKENEIIGSLAGENDCIFMPIAVNGPTTLLYGGINDEAMRFAASLTASYSSTEDQNISVSCRGKGINVTMNMDVHAKDYFSGYII